MSAIASEETRLPREKRAAGAAVVMEGSKQGLKQMNMTLCT
jgi:hypothetical protein